MILHYSIEYLYIVKDVNEGYNKNELKIVEGKMYSVIKTYLEKPYLYFYVYTTILRNWLKLKLAKWQFARTEEAMIRLQWEVEKQWQYLPYLSKAKAKLTRRKLQSIEKKFTEKELDIENTRTHILFIENTFDKILKIARKKLNNTS